MFAQYECLPCMVAQGNKAADLTGMDARARESMLREILGHLSEQPWHETPPGIARDIYRIIVKHSENDDPYDEIKTRYNNILLDMEEDLRKRIRTSPAPFETALKLAISGNLIDFGARHNIDRREILDLVEKIEHTAPARDESSLLRERLAQADTLLYLGDNCGEIVLDKLFIEYLKKAFPRLKITFAVRGAPAINDVTRKDAEETGLSEIVPVIDNGDDAPGTILENTSVEFRAAYDNADLIIAKGQGNYESLNDTVREGVFFLFMAKCPPVARLLGVEEMSLICSVNRR